MLIQNCKTRSVITGKPSFGINIQKFRKSSEEAEDTFLAEYWLDNELLESN